MLCHLADNFPGLSCYLVAVLFLTCHFLYKHCFLLFPYNIDKVIYFTPNLDSLKGGELFFCLLPICKEPTLVSIPSFQRHPEPSDGKWGLSPGWLIFPVSV